MLRPLFCSKNPWKSTNKNTCCCRRPLKSGVHATQRASYPNNSPCCKINAREGDSTCWGLIAEDSSCFLRKCGNKSPTRERGAFYFEFDQYTDPGRVERGHLDCIAVSTVLDAYIYSQRKSEINARACLPNSNGEINNRNIPNKADDRRKFTRKFFNNNTCCLIKTAKAKLTST